MSNSSPKHCQSSANFNLKLPEQEALSLILLSSNNCFLCRISCHTFFYSLCFQLAFSMSAAAAGISADTRCGRNISFSFFGNQYFLIILMSLILIFKKPISNHFLFIALFPNSDLGNGSACLTSRQLGLLILTQLRMREQGCDL